MDSESATSQQSSTSFKRLGLLKRCGFLVENTRRKGRFKHGGAMQPLDLESGCVEVQSSQLDLLALDEALGKLAEQDHAKSELVKLRYFAGLTEEQAAQILGISRSTAKRYWAFACAFLYREISKGDEPPQG